ncbi:MAG TPA: hypothetical protein VFZ47_01170, partial [Chitinophagaceae bacterium]
YLLYCGSPGNDPRFLWVLQPGPKITMQRCKIEYIDLYGESRTISVSLALKEYEMIKPAEETTVTDFDVREDPIDEGSEKL